VRERLRRFLSLERPRPSAAGAPAPDERGRFEALDPVAPGAPATPSLPPPDRFRDPPPPSGLELAAPPDGEQPFLRCRRCEADSARDARICSHCGVDLRTDDQRAFNARLWAERRREADEAERVNARVRAETDRARSELAHARLEMAARLAREVGERERARLRADGWRDAFGGGDGRPWARLAAIVRAILLAARRRPPSP
jgi:hypothetical protein